MLFRSCLIAGAYKKIAEYERNLLQVTNEWERYRREEWVSRSPAVQYTLFGMMDPSESAYRRDANRRKRIEMETRIKSIKTKIAKEKSKSEINGASGLAEPKEEIGTYGGKREENHNEAKIVQTWYLL